VRKNIRDAGNLLPLMPAEFQILLALADQDQHGLGIMNEVLERTDGAMRLWPGMLYGSLKLMTEQGLILETAAPAEAESGGGRPRYYRITDDGRGALVAEVKRLSAFVDAARAKNLLDDVDRA